MRAGGLFGVGLDEGLEQDASQPRQARCRMRPQPQASEPRGAAEASLALSAQWGCAFAGVSVVLPRQARMQYVERTEIWPIPFSEGPLGGMMNLQGEAVPVFNARLADQAAAQVRSPGPEQGAGVLVLTLQGERYRIRAGLCVDAAPRALGRLRGVQAVMRPRVGWAHLLAQPCLEDAGLLQEGPCDAAGNASGGDRIVVSPASTLWWELDIVRLLDWLSRPT